MGAQKMDVHVAGAAVQLEFEMMLLEIAQAVRHLLFAAGDGLRPVLIAIAHDAYLAGNGVESGANYELGTNGAGPQFGSSQVEIISFLEEIVGELVTLRQCYVRGLSIYPH